MAMMMMDIHPSFIVIIIMTLITCVNSNACDDINKVRGRPLYMSCRTCIGSSKYLNYGSCKFDLRTNKCKRTVFKSSHLVSKTYNCPSKNKIQPKKDTSACGLVNEKVKEIAFMRCKLCLGTRTKLPGSCKFNLDNFKCERSYFKPSAKVAKSVDDCPTHKVNKVVAKDGTVTYVRSKEPPSPKSYSSRLESYATYLEDENAYKPSQRCSLSRKSFTDKVSFMYSQLKQKPADTITAGKAMKGVSLLVDIISGTGAVKLGVKALHKARNYLSSSKKQNENINDRNDLVKLVESLQEIVRKCSHPTQLDVSQNKWGLSYNPNSLSDASSLGAASECTCDMCDDTQHKMWKTAFRGRYKLDVERATNDISGAKSKLDAFVRFATALLDTKVRKFPLKLAPSCNEIGKDEKKPKKAAKVTSNVKKVLASKKKSVGGKKN